MNEKERERKIFSDNLKFYMDKYKVNGITLASYMHVSSATISDWTNGKKMPRMDKITSLANYFRIKKSDLLEEHSETYYLNPETAQIAQEIFDDSELHALFDAARNSKPEDMRMAADLLRRLKGTNPDG